MHLLILNGAARPQGRSNTARIVSAFQSGFVEGGNTAQVFHLSDRSQWADAAAAFGRCENVLIALPLYVENIPGLLLEFLEGLAPKAEPGTRIAFLLQGGFPEASQSRCCERYLEMLPSQLGCAYAGTLIKGDMFGLGMMDKESRARALEPFVRMGRRFAATGRFDRGEASAFAAPEYLPKREARMFRLFGPAVQRVFMGRMAKKMGCRWRLDARPYKG